MRSVASVVSNSYVQGADINTLGAHRMSLSRWVEGGNPDHVTVLKWDKGLIGHCKIPAWQWAKLPRYGREGAVEVRSFPASHRNVETQGLSGEAMKGNSTTVIPRVDESKPSLRTSRRLDRT